MYHYRDWQGGDFYLDPDIRPGSTPSDVMPFLRFIQKQEPGLARELWTSTGTDGDAPWTWIETDQDALRKWIEKGEDAHRKWIDEDRSGLLGKAGLNWSVTQAEVFVSIPEAHQPILASHHRALVRPDRNEVMSVVTTAYRIAENEWVAETAVALGRQCNRTAELVGAAGFGRYHERTIFVVRVGGTAKNTLVLLAYNTHGGEGAVRFQIVEADQDHRTVLAPDSKHASVSVPHIGDVKERLELLRDQKMVKHYISETLPVWISLKDALWTPRHTRDLLQALWGKPPNLRPTTPDGTPLVPDQHALRHPAQHLTLVLAGCTVADEAYRLICAYLDNESEACERGDFTKDRDERLALGAGLRLKQRAWQWIVANTL